MSRAFPLTGLLRVRALAEDTAAAELASARREERAARERAARTAEALGAVCPPSEAGLAAWQAAVAARGALSSLLTEDVDRVRGAERSVEDRQEEWTAARIRTRAVERLRDRHDAARQEQEAQAEQAVLDEVASRTTDPTAAPGEDA